MRQVGVLNAVARQAFGDDAGTRWSLEREAGYFGERKITVGHADEPEIMTIGYDVSWLGHPRPPPPNAPRYEYERYLFVKNAIPSIIVDKLNTVASVEPIFSNYKWTIAASGTDDCHSCIDVTGNWIVHLMVMDIMNRAAGLYTEYHPPENAPVNRWIQEAIDERDGDG